MKLSRRALFFLAVAGICLVMLVPTPAEFRWVNISMAALALFWAIMLGAEDISIRRRGGPGGPPAGRPAED